MVSGCNLPKSHESPTVVPRRWLLDKSFSITWELVKYANYHLSLDQLNQKLQWGPAPCASTIHPGGSDTLVYLCIMRRLESGGPAIIRSPRPAPGPVPLSYGLSIAQYVCTEWANEWMHEWMNRKLKTNRKEVVQQMQKKLELPVRHSSRPSNAMSAGAVDLPPPTLPFRPYALSSSHPLSWTENWVQMLVPSAFLTYVPVENSRLNSFLKK